MAALIWILLQFLLFIGFLVTISYIITQNILGAILFPPGLFLFNRIIRSLLSRRKLRKVYANLGAEAVILEEDGLKFRDLNKNGNLDTYEDIRESVDARVHDLLSQMTIEEKVGQMFSPMNSVGKNGNLNEKPGLFLNVGTSELIAEKKITTFACMGSIEPRNFVKWHNAFQKVAERTRLGIPVTLCSDPRHEFRDTNNPFASLLDASVSLWPHPTGLAATRDEKLVEEFGKIACQELTALGVRFALHPMADLATEPRWGRITGTFGEDAELAGKMISAYIRGFQGEKIGNESVACCVKHFPGGGPQKDGHDPHLTYGKEQIYPGGKFDYHQIPFKFAFDAGAAAVMPYYGIPRAVENIEEIGFNFNKDVTTTLLREKFGFQGIVHTDYSIISSRKMFGITLMESTSWGVEHLSRLERVEKAVNAGIDQIGGESCVELLLKLVNKGRISEARIDESVRRVLKLKFELGLFDNPYVDAEKAEEICGRKELVEVGKEAMRRSLVLLKNEFAGKPTLPLSRGSKVYIEGFSQDEVAKYAQVVNSVEKADFTLLRIKTPHRGKPRELFDLFFSHGKLDFSKKQKKNLKKIMLSCPTIIDIYLERPAVIPELYENAAAIIGDFSAEPGIVLEAIFGEFKPTGKLPFELPRSMQAVQEQFSDVPYDSKDPVFEFGHGLTYE